MIERGYKLDDYTEAMSYGVDICERYKLTEDEFTRNYTLFRDFQEHEFPEYLKARFDNGTR